MSRQDVAVMRDALDAGQIRAFQMEANRRALAKKNLRKGILIGLNTIVAFVILLPLLYAFSVAFMPSSELFTTEMNLIPKQPTLLKLSSGTGESSAGSLCDQLVCRGRMHYDRTDHFLFFIRILVLLPEV